LVSLLLFKNNFIGLVLFNLFFIINYALGENFIGNDLDLISINGEDGRMLAVGKKNFFLGLIGLFFMLWWTIYAWLILFVGGHRSWASHGILIGTLGRILWFNVPLVILLNGIYGFGVTRWGWTSNFGYELFLDIWILPYLISQFLAWIITDLTHLLLDSSWAKFRLYTPNTTEK